MFALQDVHVRATEPTLARGRWQDGVVISRIWEFPNPVFHLSFLG
jgi:hypothetical protein